MKEYHNNTTAFYLFLLKNPHLIKMHTIIMYKIKAKMTASRMYHQGKMATASSPKKEWSTVVTTCKKSSTSTSRSGREISLTCLFPYSVFYSTGKETRRA